jgi:hypothetical protein
MRLLVAALVAFGGTVLNVWLGRLNLPLHWLLISWVTPYLVAAGIWGWQYKQRLRTMLIRSTRGALALEVTSCPQCVRRNNAGQAVYTMSQVWLRTQLNVDVEDARCTISWRPQSGAEDAAVVHGIWLQTKAPGLCDYTDVANTTILPSNGEPRGLPLAVRSARTGLTYRAGARSYYAGLNYPNYEHPEEVLEVGTYEVRLLVESKGGRQSVVDLLVTHVGGSTDLVVRAAPGQNRKRFRITQGSVSGFDGKFFHKAATSDLRAAPTIDSPPIPEAPRPEAQVAPPEPPKPTGRMVSDAIIRQISADVEREISQVRLTWQPEGQWLSWMVRQHTGRILEDVKLILIDMRWWDDHASEFVATPGAYRGDRAFQSLEMHPERNRTVYSGSSVVIKGVYCNGDSIRVEGRSLDGGAAQPIQENRKWGRWRVDMRVTWLSGYSKDVPMFFRWDGNGLTPMGDWPPTATAATERETSLESETLRIVRTDYENLQYVQKLAIQRLLATGEMTDQQMSKVLTQQGLGPIDNIFGSIEVQTNIVQRSSARDARAEAIRGYTGNWRINPAIKDSLILIVRSKH